MTLSILSTTFCFQPFLSDLFYIRFRSSQSRGAIHTSMSPCITAFTWLLVSSRADSLSTDCHLVLHISYLAFCICASRYANDAVDHGQVEAPIRIKGGPMCQVQPTLFCMGGLWSRVALRRHQRRCCLVCGHSAARGRIVTSYGS